jgi:hypothetical protein
MITRREAENQAERCLWYHIGAYVGTVMAVAAFDRPALRYVATGWGLGLLAHAALLHGFPESREMLLRTTASLMEDLHGEHHEVTRASEPRLATAR